MATDLKNTIDRLNVEKGNVDKFKFYLHISVNFAIITCYIIDVVSESPLRGVLVYPIFESFWTINQIFVSGLCASEVDR